MKITFKNDTIKSDQNMFIYCPYLVWLNRDSLNNSIKSLWDKYCELRGSI